MISAPRIKLIVLKIIQNLIIADIPADIFEEAIKRLLEDNVMV